MVGGVPGWCREGVQGGVYTHHGTREAYTEVYTYPPWYQGGIYRVYTGKPPGLLRREGITVRKRPPGPLRKRE